MVNWNLLYSQGRCKNIGIPWSDEEAHAALILRIPAEYVRRGILTKEEYAEALGKDQAQQTKTNKIPLLHLKREQLATLCERHEIHITDDAPRSALIECLLQKGLPKSLPVSEVPLAI
jgi:hypothetical protein